MTAIKLDDRTRAGARIKAKMLKGMKYTMMDWHFRTIGQGTVKNGVIEFPADKPVFYMELTR